MVSYRINTVLLIIWLYFPMVKAQDKPYSNMLVFASDTQAPLWIEKVFLKSDNNTKATELVFKDIIRLKPLAFFLLGDVVSLGYSENKWKPVDAYIKAARSEGIPIYGVLGNHELMQRPIAGEAKFQIRFPDHKRTGYVQVFDSIAVVLLNSNFNSLSPDEIKEQNKWLKDTVAVLDSSDSVKAIIFGCHHPPYTNSKLVKSSSLVQNYFVEPFLASKKAKLFITGHSHAFEYFKKKGKDFIIIGGGGGLNHPLSNSADRLEDVSAEYKPHFHYLSVEILNEDLVVVSHELQGSPFKGFEIGYSIKIPLKETN